ncbi:hypothetical protein PAXRUDRAFT_834873 [Paxillus rubicundulus Ve08.2h10]|uniref:Uncharacterized protein n=1 Tax=Paxillus rubicundulus Ve08.2h10 TaxID=930991 RepID=A0A0D0D2M8_9AGAM|nr:hypothetical protein PAXRUDRAFT_834873 [Paxillus rubicundulus Ve08.2h10]
MSLSMRPSSSRLQVRPPLFLNSSVSRLLLSLPSLNLFSRVSTPIPHSRIMSRRCGVLHTKT